MSRVSFASHPFLLGFEDLDRLVERSAKASGDAYPPYNIEQRGDDAYRIVIAVAGFGQDDLDVVVEGNQLTIRGRNKDQVADRVFLHRGIAARQFERCFVLAERVEVSEAQLADGLLRIDLVRRAKSPSVETISITRKEG